jgi:glycosyltransferase domain-containing protein
MENLTIIIPSKNRPFFLRRSTNYWNNYNFPVIIVDGSDETQKKWMDENSNRNIQYLYKKTPFPDRLNYAAKLIKTKYCILLSDDEFFCISVLKKCINFLESNNEYVAVNGCAIGFFYNFNKLMGKKKYPEWIKRSRIETDPKERIISHMKNYANPLGVSVTKSDIFEKCAELYANNEFPIFAQLELQMNLILSFVGKSKTLDELMYFRSMEEDSPSIHRVIKNHIPSLNLKNTIDRFWYEPQFEKQKIKFINVMSSLLKNLKPNYSLDYCRNALTSSIELYVKNLLLIKNKKKNFSSHAKILIYNFLPTSVINNLIKIRDRLIGNSLLDQIKIMEDEGILVDHRDINQIILALR